MFTVVIVNFCLNDVTMPLLLKCLRLYVFQGRYKSRRLPTGRRTTEGTACNETSRGSISLAFACFYG